MDEASIAIPETMQAMVTIGHGDIDQLVFHPDWPTPQPEGNEVLIKVGACGLNNTDVNTRTGWYSKSVSEATNGVGYAKVDENDPTWGGAPISFPRIQGADVCGEIIAVGKDVDTNRIGERVITDNWLRDPSNPMNMDRTGYFGSERNGGFAQYTTIPARNAIAVKSQLSDAELATFSCSFSTAEGMLARAAVSNTDCVLIPGASGGVGSALVQLAKLRGARVIAFASEAKHHDVEKLGADVVLLRHPADLKQRLQTERVTVVADIVGGVIWPDLIDILQRGGRYVCSGAIAGPLVEFDLRTFYLRDLTFLGSTVVDPAVTKNLIDYIEGGQIKPVLAATFPLRELRQAQTAFIKKVHTGNIVVLP